MAYCSRMVPKSLAEKFSVLFYHSSKLTRVAFVTHSFSWMVRRRWEKRLAGNVPISSVLLLDGDSTRFVLTWRKMN